jgi:hypothetical protein
VRKRDSFTAPAEQKGCSAKLIYTYSGSTWILKTINSFHHHSKVVVRQRKIKNPHIRECVKIRTENRNEFLHDAM